MENKCTLTNEELIAKCKAWVKSLCETGARSWSLSVPVNLDKDPDILFMELADRLAATPPPQGSAAPQTDADLVAELKLANIEERGHLKTISQLREELEAEKIKSQGILDDLKDMSNKYIVCNSSYVIPKSVIDLYIEYLESNRL